MNRCNCLPEGVTSAPAHLMPPPIRFDDPHTLRWHRTDQTGPLYVLRVAGGTTDEQWRALRADLIDSGILGGRVVVLPEGMTLECVHPGHR